MNKNDYLDRARKILETKTPLVSKRVLDDLVSRVVDERGIYLEMSSKFGSPLYIFDEQALRTRAREFRLAFEKEMPSVGFFYAIKSNYHPFIIKTLSDNGYGMDVSSGRELEMGLRYSVGRIIFSGPGKTPAELDLAAENADRVTVHLDSYGELGRLEEAAKKKDVKIRAGVRLMVEGKGLWRKFGIPLDQMSDFFKESEKCPHVDLRGFQFHTSWNLDPGRQVLFIAAIGAELAGIDDKYLKKIDFIDIGGGYWPECGEWMNPAATREGYLKEYIDPGSDDNMNHFFSSSTRIEEFASQLAGAVKTHIFTHINCDIYLEPGRWLSHDAMHVLLTVLDKKSDDTVICDGGTNMIGWERYELDYFPVINISRPGLSEHACTLFGSLCTPHDLWGYSYFGEGIEPGDILFIPTQGAYTYSLRQEFIKSLPKEIIMNGSYFFPWDRERNNFVPA